MAIEVKKIPEIIRQRKENGLCGRQFAAGRLAVSLGHYTHFRTKCGSNCKLGIKRKAGNVIRLKTPMTATNDKTTHERVAECFYRDVFND
jgi:hypothetical protein